MKHTLAKTLALAAAIALVFVAANPASSEETATTDPIARLAAGNKRFVAGFSEHPDQGENWRKTIAKKQTPFAIILACADSRVAPEIVFDQGLGDLFVIRVAGNTLDPAILGSIEYAVEHLGSHSIVVMGHERCGAVTAAIKGGHLPGSLPALVKPIQPAVKITTNMKGDRLHNTVVENVRLVTAQLAKSSHIIEEAIEKGELKVAGAVYDLDSGKVTFLKEVTVYH